MYKDSNKKESNKSGRALASKNIYYIWSYHLASGPVAPWFATAASVHCSQNLSHLYLSAHNQQRCFNYNPSISFSVGRWYGITVVIYHTSKQQAQKSIPARELIVQTKMLLPFAMFAPSFQAQQCIASFSLLTLQQTAYLPISCYTRLEAVIVIPFFKFKR